MFVCFIYILNDSEFIFLHDTLSYLVLVSFLQTNSALILPGFVGSILIIEVCTPKTYFGKIIDISFLLEFRVAALLLYLGGCVRSLAFNFALPPI